MPNRLRSARSAGRLDLTQGLCLAGRTGDRVICGRIANAGLRKIPYVSALLTLVALSRARGTVQDLYYQVRGRGRSGGHFGKQCTPSAPPLAPKT